MSGNVKSAAYIFIGGLILLVALAGCKKKEQPKPTEPQAQEPMSSPVGRTPVQAELTDTSAGPPPRVVSADTGASSGIAETMTLWKQSKQDEAIEAFVNIEWKGKVRFAESSPLALTEKEFSQLSGSERDQRMAEIMGEVIILRSLCKGVLDKSQSGPDDKKYADAILTFSKLLAEDKESLAILQILGQSLQKKAAEQPK